LCKRDANAGRGYAGSHNYEAAGGVQCIVMSLERRIVEKQSEWLCAAGHGSCPNEAGGAARNVTNCNASVDIAAKHAIKEK